MAADAAPAFRVRVVAWADAADKLRAVRLAVFVVEQNIPEELEWDEFDAPSVHVVAEDAQGAPIGCGRLLPDGHIGRMAVLSDWRGRGVGAALLVRLIELARERGDQRVLLKAQTQAMPFYARYGFAPVGAQFEEAGIAHWTMERAVR
ncbi:MAG: GNAT family N-acetyltransferase [Casimicrobiaceae bacterium]